MKIGDKVRFLSEVGGKTLRWWKVKTDSKYRCW